MALTKVSSSLIKDNTITADHLNIVGHGTAGAMLTSKGDGSFEWDTSSVPLTVLSIAVGQPPVSLNTIEKLANSLNNDEDFFNTISGLVGGLQNDIDALETRDPVLTINGDASGTATFTNLGDATLTLTISDDSHNHIISNIDGLQSALDLKANITYVDSAVANLVDSSPSALNTLNELAAALGDDPNFATTVTNLIAGKQAAGTYNTIIGTDSDIDTSGATIVDNIYVTDGVITSMGTRTLTLGDLGYTGATNANYITNNNQLTNGAGYLTSFDITTQTDSKYLRSDADDTMTGSLTVTGLLNVGSSTSSNIYMSDSDNGTRIIHNNSNRIGFLTQSSAWGSYCSDNGDWTTDFISYAGSSMRAPVFYDLNNTAYFLDPATTSDLNSLKVNSLYLDRNESASRGISWYSSSYTAWSEYMSPPYTTGCGPTANITAPIGSIVTSWAQRTFIENAGNYGWTWESGGSGGQPSVVAEIRSSDGLAQFNGGVRSPIFYDSNDTAFYVDPNSTSRFSKIQTSSSGATPRYDTAFYVIQGQHWYGDTDSQVMYIGESGNDVLLRGQMSIGGSAITPGYALTMGGSINMNNTELNYLNQLHFNDNVRFYDDGNDSYLNFKYGDSNFGGIRFRRGDETQKGFIYADNNGFGLLDSDGDWAVKTQTGTNPLSLWCDNNEEFQVFTTYTVSLGSSRAPVFYDSNNTVYYVDPSKSGHDAIKINGGIHINSSHDAGNIEVRYLHNGSTTDSQSSNIALGVSEPGITYHGAWIGCNINPSSPYYGRAINTNYGIYIRWDKHSGVTQFKTTTSTAGTAGGQGGVRFAIDPSGITTSTASSRAPIFYDSADTTYFLNPATTGDSIRVAGDIVAYYSDERLKDIKGNIENAVDKVKQLNGFYYSANETAQKLGYKVKDEVGVSAQEVEKVLPEIIKDAPIGHGYKTLDYSKIVPLLIEAIKEQQTQIDELKQLINKQ